MRRSFLGMKFRLCLALVVVLTLSQSASAADRFKVTQDRDYGRNYATGVDRLGVFVSNRPGGLYMGRLFTGDAFDAAGAVYRSRKGGVYYPAYALGKAGACAWVGPSGRVDDVGAWSVRDGDGVGSCSKSVLQWLRGGQRDPFNDGSKIYSHVNCPPPSTDGSESRSTFGGYTHTTRATPVYYNLEWKWDGARYDAIAPREEVGEIPAGSGVFYRYTANGAGYANVFFDGNSGSYGWAFIDAGAVPHVEYWSPAGDPPNYRRFDCDSRTGPATELPAPWPLWLAVGGQPVSVMS